MDCNAILQTEARESKLSVVQSQCGCKQRLGMMNYHDGSVVLHAPAHCSRSRANVAVLPSYMCQNLLKHPITGVQLSIRGQWRSRERRSPPLIALQSQPDEINAVNEQRIARIHPGGD